MTLKELEKIIPFDQFSRQYQVSVIIDTLRSGGERLKLLDVGGYKGHTADFLNKDDVTVLDLYDVSDENYVMGSALKMPFDDNSFDYVLSFDVLEHIPSRLRQKFFNECNRVSKHGIIICAPNKTAANQRAEKVLNDLYMRLHEEPHEWLKEHIEYVIPDFNKVEVWAKKAGYSTIRFHSNKVQLWVPMQEAIFLNSKFPIASEQLVEINQFYNKNFKYDGGGQQESGYRSILCCFKDKSVIKKLAKKGSLNEPIDPKSEIELFEKIANYNLTLAIKMDNLAKDYKNLHAHEKKRADTLHINSEKQHHKIARLHEALSNRARVPSLRYIRRKVLAIKKPEEK